MRSDKPLQGGAKAGLDRKQEANQTHIRYKALKRTTAPESKDPREQERKNNRPMQQSYDGVAKTLHWLILIIILPMLYFGFTHDSIPKDERLAFFQNHAGLGLVLLVLMIARLVWRLGHPAPALPGDLPRWQVIASKASHHGLYLLVILQPLIGLMMTTTGKFNLKAFGVLGMQIAPNEAINNLGHVLHGINAWAITALISLHVLAALYHHFIRKDNVLKRMLPFAKA